MEKMTFDPFIECGVLVTELFKVYNLPSKIKSFK